MQLPFSYPNLNQTLAEQIVVTPNALHEGELGNMRISGA